MSELIDSTEKEHNLDALKAKVKEKKKKLNVVDVDTDVKNKTPRE
jgi:hypothetical protein